MFEFPFIASIFDRCRPSFSLYLLALSCISFVISALIIFISPPVTSYVTLKLLLWLALIAVLIVDLISPPSCLSPPLRWNDPAFIVRLGGGFSIVVCHTVWTLVFYSGILHFYRCFFTFSSHSCPCPLRHL